MENTPLPATTTSKFCDFLTIIVMAHEDFTGKVVTRSGSKINAEIFCLVCGMCDQWGNIFILAHGHH